MTGNKALLAASAALTLLAAAPAAGQAPPAADAPPTNPYRGLWTSWSGAIDDSLDAEARARAEAGRTAAPAASVPASSNLVPARSRAEAEALGARVGAIVRGGDCEEGERIARAAGDFPLVQAVRDHCRRGDTPH
jgi:hypothetical protein